MIADKTKPTLLAIKKELEKERDRIKAILARRAHKDTAISGNYVTDFPNIGDDQDDSVFEEVTYEENVAIEHVLEKRLKQIESDLKKIEEGSYSI
jgi:RNA polymerase-binding transcription factor DksA